jgi:hypothetical protein
MTDPATERLAEITQQQRNERYSGNLRTLTEISRTLLLVTETLDVREMRSTCERFQAIAPVLEPTAYIRGGSMNLADQAAFLAAVDDFVTALRKLDRRPTTT